MTFGDICETVRVGDLLLFSGERWWSRIIRLRSQSKWSHVGIVVWVPRKGEDGHPQIVEALEGHGVRVANIHWWRKWRGTVAVGYVNLPEPARFKMADFASRQRGRLYASPRQFVRSFSLLWSRIAPLLGIRADNDVRRWFCSELAAAAFRFTGYVTTPKEPARMTPGDVASLQYVTVQEGVTVPC
jgi:hypothetical protein